MPCNYATTEFLEMLSQIEPSRVRDDVLHYPCRLELKDGRVIDQAICVEDSRGFEADWWIHPNEVRKIERSHQRLPSHLASKLYAAGESGMGYEVFGVKTKDERHFTCVTHNVVDFPQIPHGIETKDIEDVCPHQGREHFGSDSFYDKPPKFTWCYFLKKDNTEPVVPYNSGQSLRD